MTVFANQLPRIIDGQLITRHTAQAQMLADAGVKLSQLGRLATVQVGRRALTLHRWRVITRPSGRRHRHLSYYLVGLLDGRQPIEVFLAVVENARGLLFRLQTGLQRGLLGLAAALLSPGLNSFQKIAAVL